MVLFGLKDFKSVPFEIDIQSNEICFLSRELPTTVPVYRPLQMSPVIPSNGGAEILFSLTENNFKLSLPGA